MSTITKMKKAVSRITEAETKVSKVKLSELPDLILKQKHPDKDMAKWNKGITAMSTFVANELKSGNLESADAIKALPDTILMQQLASTRTAADASYNHAVETISKFVKATLSNKKAKPNTPKATPPPTKTPAKTDDYYVAGETEPTNPDDMAEMFNYIIEEAWDNESRIAGVIQDVSFREQGGGNMTITLQSGAKYNVQITEA